jgi:hypothetical protein|nr:MAG TPA: hypothetical protein [Caudoviricetes sp.]
MKVLLNGKIKDLSLTEVEDLIELGYISGSLEEYLQSGDIPECITEYKSAIQELDMPLPDTEYLSVSEMVMARIEMCKDKIFAK